MYFLDFLLNLFGILRLCTLYLQCEVLKNQQMYGRLRKDISHTLWDTAHIQTVGINQSNNARIN